MAEASTTPGVHPAQTTTPAYMTLDEIGARIGCIIDDADNGRLNLLDSTLDELRQIYDEQKAVTNKLQAQAEDSTARDAFENHRQDLEAAISAFLRIAAGPADDRDGGGDMHAYRAAGILQSGAWETLDSLRRTIDRYHPAPSNERASS